MNTATASTPARYRVLRTGSVRVCAEGSPAFDGRINSSADAYRFLSTWYAERQDDQERFTTMVLDQRHRPWAVFEVSVGTLSGCMAHPREVFRPALICGPCAGIITAHNHPSGDPDPSDSDKVCYKQLRQAGDILGIKLLDNIVLGTGRWYSFSDSYRFTA